MKLIKSQVFGLGIGFDYKINEFYLHLFIYCLEIKF
jgi:hypothetical protein